jgi:hypothetical protein
MQGCHEAGLLLNYWLSRSILVHISQVVSSGNKIGGYLFVCVSSRRKFLLRSENFARAHFDIADFLSLKVVHQTLRCLIYIGCLSKYLIYSQ